MDTTVMLFLWLFIGLPAVCFLMSLITCIHTRYSLFGHIFPINQIVVADTEGSVSHSYVLPFFSSLFGTILLSSNKRYKNQSLIDLGHELAHFSSGSEARTIILVPFIYGCLLIACFLLIGVFFPEFLLPPAGQQTIINIGIIIVFNIIVGVAMFYSGSFLNAWFSRITELYCDTVTWYAHQGALQAMPDSTSSTNAKSFVEYLSHVGILEDEYYPQKGMINFDYYPKFTERAHNLLSCTTQEDLKKNAIKLQNKLQSVFWSCMSISFLGLLLVIGIVNLLLN